MKCLIFMLLAWAAYNYILMSKKKKSQGKKSPSADCNHNAGWETRPSWEVKYERMEYR